MRSMEKRNFYRWQKEKRNNILWGLCSFHFSFHSGKVDLDTIDAFLCAYSYYAYSYANGTIGLTQFLVFGDLRPIQWKLIINLYAKRKAFLAEDQRTCFLGFLEFWRWWYECNRHAWKLGHPHSLDAVIQFIHTTKCLIESVQMRFNSTSFSG